MRISPILVVVPPLFVLLILAGCAGSQEPTSRSDLEREFQAEFGFSPPSKLTEMRCKIVWVGDTWAKWMLFTYDEETIDRIASTGFSKTGTKELGGGWEAIWSRDLMASQPNPNAPKWFRLPSQTPAHVYYKEGHPRDSSGYSYIWIDDTNKTVYAKSSAWH